MAAKLTPGNTDDRKPVPDLVSKLSGWLFGDKGYLSKELLEKLKAQSLEIFTKVKKNMKERMINIHQKFFLGKRGLIETVNDQLKNSCYIEHTRHRKPENAFVNLVSGLIAYFFKLRKPSIKNDKLSPESPIQAASAPLGPYKNTLFGDLIFRGRETLLILHYVFITSTFWISGKIS